MPGRKRFMCRLATAVTMVFIVIAASLQWTNDPRFLCLRKVNRFCARSLGHSADLHTKSSISSDGNHCGGTEKLDRVCYRIVSCSGVITRELVALLDVKSWTWYVCLSKHINACSLSMNVYDDNECLYITHVPYVERRHSEYYRLERYCIDYDFRGMALGISTHSSGAYVCAAKQIVLYSWLFPGIIHAVDKTTCVTIAWICDNAIRNAANDFL